MERFGDVANQKVGRFMTPWGFPTQYRSPGVEFPVGDLLHGNPGLVPTFL
jgi:hypothetical protein